MYFHVVSLGAIGIYVKCLLHRHIASASLKGFLYLPAASCRVFLMSEQCHQPYTVLIGVECDVVILVPGHGTALSGKSGVNAHAKV